MKKILNAIALGLVLALALSITFSNGAGTVTATTGDGSETVTDPNAGNTGSGGGSDEGNTGTGGNTGNGGSTSGNEDVSGNNPGTTPAQPEAETTGVTYGSTESNASNYTKDKVTTVLTEELNANASVMKDALPEGKKLDLSKKDKIVVKASFSLKLEEGQTVPKDGKVVVSGITGLSTDRIYMAVHYHSNGTKEFHKVSVGADGKITIYGIKSFSDFVLIDVTDALVPTGDNGTTTPASTATTTAADPAVSPKTGETVPVVVVFSLLALASCAAVGIKRARFSR